MKKNIVFVLLTVLLSLSVLSSCDGETPATTPITPSTSSPEESTTSAAGGETTVPDNTTTSENVEKHPVREVEYITPANTEATAVHVNQVGYLTNGVKRAVVVGGGVDFLLLKLNDDGTGSVAYTGPVVAITNEVDKLSGDICCYADFTEFTEPGKYQLCVNGANGICAASYMFEIGDNVYDTLRTDLLRMLYYQRCGTALEEPYAQGYPHKKCHSDYNSYIKREYVTTNPNNPKEIVSVDGTGAIDVHGGWHEAGDYSKTIGSGACAAADLLNAYRLWPEQFGDNSNIPESGNGIPDVLDEVRWELEWFLKMQEPTSGGFYTTAFPWTHPGPYMPEHVNDTYYVWPPCIETTGQAVGCLALASRIYRDVDAEFADRCFAAAQKGWEYLEAHPDNIPARKTFTGFGNGYGDIIGLEGDTNDERLWAAAEMYLCTGKAELSDLVYNLCLSVQNTVDYNKQHFGGFAALSLILNGTENEVPEPTLRILKKRFLLKAEEYYKCFCDSGYNVILDHFGWTSNGQLTKRAMIMITAEICDPTLDYSDPIQTAFNYLLGQNALSLSFITGYGTYRVNNPHHNQCTADNIAEAIPGYMVAGAGAVEDILITHKDFTDYVPLGTPQMKSFVDNSKFYRTIEVEVDWNSYPVFVAAYIADKLT